MLMSTYSYLRTLLIVGGTFLSPLVAQNQQIKKLLDKAGLKYEVTEGGDFKLTFNIGDGRSQLVFIEGSMEEMGGQSIVEIWSPGYKGAEISEKTLAYLLVESGKKKVGAWEVMSDNDNIYAVFMVKVPLASLSPGFLRSACEGAALTADNAEKTFLQSDEL
ncbi:MAG: hypothetical protein KatS3mg025_1892 [Bacteroidia bacterium]|jgi:hypothetical protein|nr:MAG: hypothetical protein KatS3mg025_1892 [Bacteroidia bacterium]